MPHRFSNSSTNAHVHDSETQTDDLLSVLASSQEETCWLKIETLSRFRPSEASGGTRVKRKTSTAALWTLFLHVSSTLSYILYPFILVLVQLLFNRQFVLLSAWLVLWLYCCSFLYCRQCSTEEVDFSHPCGPAIRYQETDEKLKVTLAFLDMVFKKTIIFCFPLRSWKYLQYFFYWLSGVAQNVDAAVSYCLLLHCSSAHHHHHQVSCSVCVDLMGDVFLL